jgi:L,D-peptidoglycan transpeptidase YkuD (ErfK/YbiS/YcfS/YnhG family)
MLGLLLLIIVGQQGIAVADPVSTPFGQSVWIGDARQIITVKSIRPGSTYANFTGWSIIGGRWARSFGPVEARVGAAGTTTSPRDNYPGTPIGTFTLRQAFGLRTAPAGTTLPYRVLTSNDWWVSDSGSRYYNTWQVGPPNGRWNPAIGERLAAYSAYAYAVVMDYNRNPIVKGRGSAFFLHVGNGQPTAGCVSVSSGHMQALLRWLVASSRPRIAIL